MVTKETFKAMLNKLGFTEVGRTYFKHFDHCDDRLAVDFTSETLIYPKALTVHGEFTCSFGQNENFVVFECVHRLLSQGYFPEHLELEPKWQLGHGASGGRADILVRDREGKVLLIIECKTAGAEFNSAWKQTQNRATQIFSYAQQARSTKFIALYSSDLVDGRVTCNYHLINLQDNEKLLEEKKQQNPKSYAEATSVDEIYEVWQNTYQGDAASVGLFERDIRPYEIGKSRYNIHDLTNVSSRDIQGKYHEFATILRQHNVSGRENAFDKLVNLFLCKVVDEARNPHDLHFYWRGIAYDSPFELQDRLQKLYKEGMKEFLGEEVTYIDNRQIDEAFRFFKNDPDATRDTIKKYFRELKFFTNNDFAFIDVHNEKLFYQNAAVLLKIVQMLQGIRLKTEEQNQFLGDMFEGFLDQGVKQSEGQFFTPMPIVKFILRALPIEALSQSEQIPSVIDYACGAGHFLSEYAARIKPLAESLGKEPADFYGAITGIEKEYRLSKVAKVSSFMYGQDNIRIIYHDALAHTPHVKEGSFSLLVANPPYSVKGFLETLTLHEREAYELTQTVDDKSLSVNNAIECFFIERAKQLLASGGVAGIIVPSSILNKGTQSAGARKGNVYVATRELLLRYFDIVAITEFGSGTFGKTGTNTVTLFLRRKASDPDIAEHYRNRVAAWFTCNAEGDDTYDDRHLIHRYCEQLEYDLDAYQSLLRGSPNETLLGYETFVQYKKSFEALSETKTRKKQKSFKALAEHEQQAEMDRRFTEFLHVNERDKLYYFILALSNPQEVLIIRSPSDTAARKKFLGYEWSSAKGNEGIKYLSSAATPAPRSGEEEETFDEEEARILANLMSLGTIDTPLYDPDDPAHPEKLATLVTCNFGTKALHIPETLQEFATTAKLVDMIDFSRAEFNKAISLTPKKSVLIESRWPQAKIMDITTLMRRGKTADYGQSDIQIIKSGQARGRKEFDFSQRHYVAPDFISDERNLQKSDLLLNSTGKGTAGRVTYFNLEGRFVVDSHITILRLNHDVALPLYVLNVLDFIGFKTIEEMATGQSGQIELSLEIIGHIKIPLPPLEVQQQIVAECEAVDAEAEAAKEAIENAKNKKASILNKIESSAVKMSELITTNPSKREISSLSDEFIVSFVEMASVSNEGFIEHKIDRPLSELKKGSFTYFREGDIIIAKIAPSMENGKCALAIGLTNKIGMGSSEFHVLRSNEKLLNSYLFAYINQPYIREEAAKHMTGASGHRRVPIEFYENLTIPLPPLETQQVIVEAIEAQEHIIADAKRTIDAAPAKKAAILKRYM